MQLQDLTKEAQAIAIESDIVGDDGYIYSCCYEIVTEQGFCPECWEHCV